MWERLVEFWLLSGEVDSPLLDFSGGDDGEAMGGGGERMRFGVILTMGLMLLFFDIGVSTCLASGEGVDGRASTSGLQPGVSAISRTAPDDLCCW